jgi:hypothetical protein
MYLKKNRKIYLVMGFTDMRKQINGLAQIAEAKKPKELLSGNYFCQGLNRPHLSRHFYAFYRTRILDSILYRTHPA